MISFADVETHGILSLQSVLGTGMYIMSAVVVGSFSALIRRLQREVEERRKAEDMLKEYKANLEELVALRTRELDSANRRLHQIEKMEAIGQLAGGIAHDFNNNLTIIQGYCEFLLGRTELDPELRRVLKQINHSGRRSADLTRQLLAFSRRGMYEMQVVDMNEVVNETANLLSRSIHKNITLIPLSEATYPWVWGGSAQLQNAVLNLALNARDAMPNGGVLTIKTENKSLDESLGQVHGFSFQPGDYVVVSVVDSGTGIEEGVIDHIFEPFFTTKKEQQGTGMGLAAVYGIAKSHGGAITVDSKIGEGTSFLLYLPVTQKRAEKYEKENLTLGTTYDEQVLIVDDDQQVSQTIRQMLKGLGYRVLVAGSGEEAVSLYRGKHKDITYVFIDMLMPGMDGGQTFTKLKEINPDIRAVIISGFSVTKNVQHALDNGAAVFLQKPFSYEQLKKTLVSISS